VRENPIIGYDVTGDTVSEAARIEPLAGDSELLASEAFWSTLAGNPIFAGFPVERIIAKPYGEHQKGDRVSLFRIRPSSSS